MPDEIDHAIALEKRLAGMENSLHNLEGLYGSLLSEAKIRNGRIEKLDIAFKEFKDKIKLEAAFISGRASMRKTDLAVVGLAFTAISTVVGVIIRVVWG